MTVKDLKNILAHMPEDADIVIHEGGTNLVTEPKQIDLGNDGNVWICTEDDNFAAYIHPENQGRLTNEMFIHNLKIEGIKSVFNEEGEEFTISQLEEFVEHPVLKMGMIGPYYYSDPTEEV